MTEEHKEAGHVLLSGADYLDKIIVDLETREAEMRAQAAATSFDSVKDGYVKFAEVLHHCAVSLREKSAELREDHPA